MDYVQTLAKKIATINSRKSADVGALHGIIYGSNVLIDGKYYPFITAVDCNTNSGSMVYCQLTKCGMAVIIGV